MISRDIAVVDVHPEHWIRLVRGPGQAGQNGSQGWLLLVHENSRVIHARLRGRLVPGLAGQPLSGLDLAGLRKRHRASRVVCLERDFLRRALGRVDSQLAYDMDYVQQLLLVVGAFRRERGSGIQLDPPSPPGPLPPYGLLQAAFDSLWPDGTSILLYVVDDELDEIWTSLILRKTAGDLDLLTSDLHLGADGLDSSCWRGDRERLLAVVAERVAPAHLACFASLAAWREWGAASLGSAAFARLRASQDLLLDPYPRRLAWPVGLARALAGGLRWSRGIA